MQYSEQSFLHNLLSALKVPKIKALEDSGDESVVKRLKILVF